jgi:predicted HTH domain antitoxin
MAVNTANALEIHASREVLDIVGATDERDLLFFLCAKLFEAGKLSMGRAAEICAMPYAEFMMKLGTVGVPVISYSDEELQDELRDV